MVLSIFILFWLVKTSVSRLVPASFLSLRGLPVPPLPLEWEWRATVNRVCYTVWHVCCVYMCSIIMSVFYHHLALRCVYCLLCVFSNILDLKYVEILTVYSIESVGDWRCSSKQS